MDTDSIANSVHIVAEPWAKSPYYDDAEKWTFMFWGESTPFRKLFDQLDLTSTLELACGYGRHAEQIVEQTGSLILLDIFEQNLARCRERLHDFHHVQYITGDGFTFQPIAKQSITAIYCYDAMVHFSPDIVESYLIDAARILKPGGKMLLHHSNYDTQGNDQHYGRNPHARNHMTYDLFAEFAARAGLVIVESIPIDWGRMNRVTELDRITLLKKP